MNPTKDPLPGLSLVLDRAARDPVEDIAIGPAWLRAVARSQAGPALRAYRPQPTVAFSGRDCLEPGIGAATRAARALGFAAVRRGPGGRAAAYHPGAIGLDQVRAEPLGMDSIRNRFIQFGDLLTGALRSLGVDAQLGPVPGEYCPGEFSINDGRGHKLVGTAQRLIPGGWLFSSMILVTDADSVRDVLEPVYAALGLPWDPATVGAVEDIVPGIGSDEVERAVLLAYAQGAELMPAQIPRSVIDLARQSSDRHIMSAQ